MKLIGRLVPRAHCRDELIARDVPYLAMHIPVANEWRSAGSNRMQQRAPVEQHRLLADNPEDSQPVWSQAA
jgi:hypothetical protein